jgi:hypothetical protein
VVACTPHPGYGTVSVRNGALVRHVDLETCRTWTTRVTLPTLRRQPVTLAASRTGKRGTQQIRYRGRPIYTVRERYDRIPGGSPGPIELFGTSPDGAWVLFAIDPQNSASLAADGLTLQAVSIHGGRPRTVATGLLADDYRTWCGGTLVMTVGGDRIAAHHKWLIATGPPAWRARILVRDPKRAFGSLACAGDAVVVQATRDLGVDEAHVGFPRWSLWRVEIATGRTQILDTPPPGGSDDSPRVSRTGTIVFVRSRKGRGTLYALARDGPLVAVGRDDGYDGHRPWAGVSWSLQR